jgi:hypothetical protein
MVSKAVQDAARAVSQDMLHGNFVLLGKSPDELKALAARYGQVGHHKHERGA